MLTSAKATACHITKRARANAAGEVHNVQWDEDRDWDEDKDWDEDRYCAEDRDHELVEQQHIDNVERIRFYIDQFDKEQLSKILIQAIEDPTVCSMVDDAIDEYEEIDSKNYRGVNFDHYTNSIWDDIDIKYSGIDIPTIALNDIFSSIAAIVNQCGSSASRQTRFNGLSALCKIGKALALPSTSLGHEVLGRLQWNDNPVLEYGMLDIFAAMTFDEKEDISNDMSSPEALLPKLLELNRLARSNSIFEKLKVILEMFGYERDGSGRWQEDRFNEEEQELFGEDLNEGEFNEDEDCWC